MDGYATLWLQVLLIAALAGLVVRLRQGWRWSWPTAVPFVMIGALGIWGLTVGPAGPCSAIGWALYLVFGVLPRWTMGRFNRHLNLLDIASAAEEAGRMQLLMWGKPGRFWKDTAEALRLAMGGELRAAEQRLRPYLVRPASRGYRDAAWGYMQTARVLARDWEGLREDFEASFGDFEGPLPMHAASGAWRAYLELGALEEAVECLARTDLASARMSARALWTLSLPFFAVAGAEARLEQALNAVGLPAYARGPWRARCLAAQGRLVEAHETMGAAIAEVPDDQRPLAEQLAALRAELDTTPRLAGDPQTAGLVARVTALLERPLRTAAIIAPETPGRIVTVLVVLIALAHAVGMAHTFAPSAQTFAWGDAWLRFGQLLPSAVKSGEHWRVVSYMFLHGDWMHLGLNLFALSWLGRTAEAIFGGWGLLAIFFVSGALGAAAHIGFAPDVAAVGASGAIMGVFGATISGMVRSRRHLPADMWRSLVQRMLVLAMIQLTLDQMLPHVATYVHAGGLLAGALVGFVWPLRAGRSSAP